MNRMSEPITEVLAKLVERGLVATSETPEQLPGGLEVLEVHVEYDVVCSPCKKSV